MSPRVDPRERYRRAIAVGNPWEIVETARACRGLSLEEALPALLALVSRTDIYDRAVERWLSRFQTETITDERELGLLRASLEALKGVDATALVGVDAMMQLAEIRGWAFARSALAAWLEHHERI